MKDFLRRAFTIVMAIVFSLCVLAVAPRTAHAATIKVTNISIYPKSTTIYVGENIRLQVFVNPSNASNKCLQWSSSNTRVATVNSWGCVFTKSAGFTNIYATTTDGSKKTTVCSITVKQPEKAYFPMRYLKISQGVNGYYSHKGTNAIDVTGWDANIDNVVAPFTGVIKKKAEGSVNAVWLESCDKVKYADGTIDYMTVLFMHDNYIKDLYVGQVIKQGVVFYQEGSKGLSNLTGNHVHIECGRGQFSGTGWYTNSSGNWTINNSFLPYQALYIKSSTVKINGNYNYPWILG